LEIPESVLKRQGCPAEYESKSSKKGWKRFHTPRIKELLESLVEAEERLAEAQKDEMRRLFEKFDTSREVWSAAVRPWPRLHEPLLLEIACGA
jgi:DNA mismatch repair protein MSH6